jgi:glycosyltransferase involved in cell wall biosynthesis
MTNKKTILFFVTEDWYFCLHWLNFALAAQRAGFDVTVVTQVSDKADEIRVHGLKLIPIELSRHGINPLDEIRLLRKLIAIYRHERPNVVHHVAMKPIVYGSIAAMFCGVERIVNAVAGLGYLFSTQSLKSSVLRPVIKSFFRVLRRVSPSTFVFQNPDDAERIFAQQQRGVAVILGVGVDTQRFSFSPLPGGTPQVILPARLLWDKGVAEFVAAARYFKQRSEDCRFVLVGTIDESSPSAVPLDQVRAWVSQGVVEWWGFCDDMPSVYTKSTIVCLPSYREGLPTCLLEAAACGRPLVATDAPGCREIVRDGDNGILAPVGNEQALINALTRLLSSVQLRAQMGARGRVIVEQEFTVETVVGRYLALYDGKSGHE